LEISKNIDMKTWNTFITLLFVLALSLQFPTAHAQGTAFTYQGRLNSGGAPANGTYDLTFTLYTTNVTGSAVAGPVTNSMVGVTNGLFTTLVDFSNAFTGTSNWLEIAVSTSGANSYTTLAPRQQITPTPYAIYAPSAGTALMAVTANSVAAGNISGVIPVAQLPGALPWQIVAGTSQQAQPNTSYLLTNDSLVTVTLPSSPNLGDVVRINGSGTNGWKIIQNGGQFVATGNLSVGGPAWTARAGSQNWSSVASAMGGGKLVAVVNGGQIYTSTDSGVTWTARANSTNWSSVASSSDGTKLVAVVYGGPMYTSSDSGVTWNAHGGTTTNWLSVACSTDGTKIVAVNFEGQIWTSTVSGVNLTVRDLIQYCHAVASSADGTKLVAVLYPGQIYTSVNSGVAWTARNGNQNWQSVASSADGTKLVAVVYGGPIYTSSDSGVTWTVQNSGSQNWQSVASSADGTVLIAAVNGGQIWTSINSGVTWTAQNSGGQNWASVACSVDGTKLVAAVPQGQIYTSTSATTTSTGTGGSLHGNQNAAIELQYLGNGQFAPISSAGAIQAF
jgi:hypothetical protein